MNIPKEAIEIRYKLLEAFRGVEFIEDGHRYIIKSQPDRPVKSVSALLEYFYDKFDTVGQATKYAADRGFTVQQVIDAWQGESDWACMKGSAIHGVLENWINWKYWGIGEEPKIIDKQALGGIQFLQALPDYIIPVCTELSMYNENEYWYVGTADIIAYNTILKKLIILDWKSNGELTSKFDNGLLKNIPTNHNLKQDNFGKYTLQFSFYQILLEEMTGMEVDTRVLIWLQPDPDWTKRKLYQTFRTQDLTKELRTWLKTGKHLN